MAAVIPRLGLLFAQIFLLCCSWVSGLEFEMQAQVKCLSEELNSGVMVIVNYNALRRDNGQAQHLDARVEDPRGTVLYDRHWEHEGQFAFTTKSGGEYRVCFTVADLQVALNTRLNVDWKSGIAATDWEAVAKKENLDSLSTELRRLEATIRDIHYSMDNLRRREEEMRDLNEATNERVAWFSVASLLICLASSAWQLWYLKRFFQRKKLL